MNILNKALFLDRDGVINDNKRPINNPEDFKLYDGVTEALRRAEGNGFEIFVVTNQGGIELGYMTVDELNKIHDKMIELLKPYCHIKEIKFCPDYHKDTGCRKPSPKMILDLAEKYDIDLGKSYMIGDRDTDIEAGKRAGCKTGKIGRFNAEADINGKDLYAVVNNIIN
ncbi:HAD family hydrolase [Clostridium pasteurianum]|uniref:D-glycero-alpha-D-manno-heptose-1,7-bisphosphate 7-phosphatase n=1 Tax=Clostridium pasteurianum TaxID=1501 RepID=UPI001F24CD7E|nr:HAD family hydrolase [Clostridium pasteurianum]UZW15819.1 HAD family hydrolase [Clostridium pasteurianum]